MFQWAFRGVLAACLLAWMISPVAADDADPKAKGDDTAAASGDVKADDAGKEDAHAKEGDDHAKAGDGHAKEGDGHAKEGDGHGDDHAKHGDVDEFDLSHSNALPSQEKPEEWKFDLAIYTFIVFMLLMGILLKFAWGPIMASLENRENRIASLIDTAEQSAVRAQQQLADYEAKLAEAHVEAESIVAKAKQSAQDQADRIVADAKTASQREKDQALAEIELAKNEALGEVTQKSVDIALGLAKSILGREVQSADHDSLIKEALEKFPV